MKLTLGFRVFLAARPDLVETRIPWTSKFSPLVCGPGQLGNQLLLALNVKAWH